MEWLADIPQVNGEPTETMQNDVGTDATEDELHAILEGGHCDRSVSTKLMLTMSKGRTLQVKFPSTSISPL